jgi:hypothetical protein
MATAPKFNYRYPLTKLTDSDDYLRITFLEYVPPGLIPGEGTFALPSSDDVYKNVGDSEDIKRQKGTVILPIPDDIKDSNSVKWGGSSMGPIQAMAAAGTAGLLDTKDMKDLENKLLATGTKLKDAGMSGTTQKMLQAVLINKGANLLSGKNLPASELTSRFAGAVFNSNIELLFDGINLRQAFSFSYDIVPRSEREATEVKNIIRKFKIHGAAKKGTIAGGAAGLFLKAPEVFRIEYMSGGRRHPYLNRFKICALNNITVNYTGSGTYATYSDATPVHMTMTLTFQELTPIYAEDYETGTGTEGTGF